MTSPTTRIPILTIAICVIGMAAAAWLFWWAWPILLAVSRAERIGRTFYIPSQSMLPTLEVNDRIWPMQIPAAGLQRGDVVVFKTQGEIRTARIAARGGDTVQLQAGVVRINGRPVAQRLVGAGPLFDGVRSRLLSERFPGERGSHHILDLGAASFDDITPVHVAPGKLYLLGDNRDRAADSRVSLRELGVEQVRESDVLGVVDTVYWSSKRSRIGRQIDEVRVEGMAK